jgi:prolyl oligopeptidase
MFSFSNVNLFFAKHFGYVAVANLRGGGEFGQDWHNAGRLLNKQNVFDDFHAAAEFLVIALVTIRIFLTRVESIR